MSRAAADGFVPEDPVDIAVTMGRARRGKTATGHANAGEITAALSRRGLYVMHDGGARRMELQALLRPSIVARATLAPRRTKVRRRAAAEGPRGRGTG